MNTVTTIAADEPLTFTAAHAEFRRLLRAEQNLPDEHTDDDVDVAADATTAALLLMLAIPASSVAEALQKLAAVRALYDVTATPHLDEVLDELRDSIVGQARAFADATAGWDERYPLAPTEPEAASEPNVWPWLARLRASRWWWVEPHCGGMWKSGDRYVHLGWLGLQTTVFYGREEVLRHG